jgi:hypothetical protein
VSVFGGRTSPVVPLIIKLPMVKLLLTCMAETGSGVKKKNAKSNAAWKRFAKTWIEFIFSATLLNLVWRGYFLIFSFSSNWDVTAKFAC